MKSSITVLLLALFFAVSSFAAPPIENPSDEALKNESEILKRVVSLGENKICSGTWLQPGVILTAGICERTFIEGDGGKHLIVNGVDTPVLNVATVSEYNAAQSRGETGGQDDKSGLPPELLQLFGGSGVKAEGREDLLMILVDDVPLQKLKLPTDRLRLAASREGKIDPGTKILYAGYGLSKLTTLADGKPILSKAESAARKEAKLQAAYGTAAQLDPKSGYDLGIMADRRLLSITECKKGFTLYKEANRYCRTRYEYSDDGKSQASMFVSGDWGAPAFVKNAKGDWVLLGLASKNGFSPQLQQAFDTRYSLGESKASKKLEIPAEAFAEIQGQQATDFQKFGFAVDVLSELVIAGNLGLKEGDTLAADFRLEIEARAKVRGLFSTVTSAEMHDGIEKMLLEARKALNDYHTAFIREI